MSLRAIGRALSASARTQGKVNRTFPSSSRSGDPHSGSGYYPAKSQRFLELSERTEKMAKMLGDATFTKAMTVRISQRLSSSQRVLLFDDTLRSGVPIFWRGPDETLTESVRCLAVRGGKIRVGAKIGTFRPSGASRLRRPFPPSASGCTGSRGQIGADLSIFNVLNKVIPRFRGYLRESVNLSHNNYFLWGPQGHDERRNRPSRAGAWIETCLSRAQQQDVRRQLSPRGVD